MKVCPNCGRTYASENASFCPQCGVRLVDGEGTQQAGSGSQMDAVSPAAGIPDASFNASNLGYAVASSGVAGSMAAAVETLKRIAAIAGIIAAIFALVPLSWLCLDGSAVSSTADEIDDIRMSVNSSYNESSAVNLGWGNPDIDNLASYINQSEEDYRHLGAGGSGVDVSGFNGIEQTLTILWVLSIAGGVLYLISIKLHKRTLRLIGAAVVAVAALAALIATARANASIASCLNALASQVASLNRSGYASQLAGYAQQTCITQPFTSWVALLGIMFSEATMAYLRKNGQDA